jgi:hypothetical protein
MTAPENPAWLRAIDDMRAYSKELPEEPMWSVGVAQTLADVIAELDPVLTLEQRAILIGVGSIIVREGEKETSAWLQALRGLGMVRDVQMKRGGAA